MKKIIENIIELELLFSYNHYSGSGKTPYVIEEGTIPIMISAPHAVNQYREGQVKKADVFTGGIARYLHEVTGCHIIYSCMNTGSDPNYDEPDDNLYQMALIEYLKYHRVNLLLDLHGANINREYAVELGTAVDSSSEIRDEDPSLRHYKYIDDVIKQIFEKEFCDLSVKQKEVWKNIVFTAGNQNTITKYISKNTSTSCVQLEINSIYRQPNNEEAFIRLIDAFVKIIDFFSNVDWTNDSGYSWLGYPE